MKMVSLSDAKANLSRHVERVRHGHTVRIQVRGVPVAELVPVGGGGRSEPEDAELDEMERAGLIRRGTGRLVPEILKPGPAVRGSAMAALIAERRNGR